MFTSVFLGLFRSVGFVLFGFDMCCFALNVIVVVCCFVCYCGVLFGLLCCVLLCCVCTVVFVCGVWCCFVLVCVVFGVFAVLCFVCVVRYVGC